MFESLIRGYDATAQCRAVCIETNYGQLYDIAGDLNPLSYSGAAGYVVSEVGTSMLERKALYGSLKYDNSGPLTIDKTKDFAASRRQLRTLKQFRAFSYWTTILGVGAAGFQTGAQGYCAIQCIDPGE